MSKNSDHRWAKNGYKGQEPAVGDRVIVRRILPDTPGHLSDIIGHVESVDPLIVRPQSVGGFKSSAEAVEIPFDLVQVVKVLPPQRVRNSDIRAVEVATAKAFPGIEHTWVDGWLLRAGDGITERSNSAAPLGASTGFSEVPMDTISEFYKRHNLPIRLLIPDRIGNPASVVASQPGWKIGTDIIVMTRSLEDLTFPSLPTDIDSLGFFVDDQPSDDWLSMYHFRGRPLPLSALSLLRERIDGHMGFGSLRTADGTCVAITRGTITASDDGRTWLGYSAVEVAPAYRRRGLGTALGSAMLRWGQANGASDAYLQVISTNDAGIALYNKLNFLEHHRHRYAEFVGN